MFPPFDSQMALVGVPSYTDQSTVNTILLLIYYFLQISIPVQRLPRACHTHPYSSAMRCGTFVLLHLFVMLHNVSMH